MFYKVFIQVCGMSFYSLFGVFHKAEIFLFFLNNLGIFCCSWKVLWRYEKSFPEPRELIFFDVIPYKFYSLPLYFYACYSFDFNFVNDVSYTSRFVISHVDVQLFQLHLFVEKTVVFLWNCFCSGWIGVVRENRVPCSWILVGRHLVS